jgi:hypothetical protein
MTMSAPTTRRLTLLRIVLALAGFAVALLAIALEDRRLGWAAIALLLASLLVRLVLRGSKSD